MHVRAILTLDFFGLLRPGKLTTSPHAIQFVNIQCTGQSVLIKMDSSKCNKTATPQLLWVCSQPYNMCPVQAVSNYLAMRPNIKAGQLLLTQMASQWSRAQLASILDKLSVFLNLPHQVIKPHSLCIGAPQIYIWGVLPLQKIQRWGWWSSDCFKKYIRI